MHRAYELTEYVLMYEIYETLAVALIHHIGQHMKQLRGRGHTK